MSSFKLSFPESLYCCSSQENLDGVYKLSTAEDGLPFELISIHDTRSMNVYEYLNGNVRNFLVYCEGTPELLPANLWSTILADALSRHPEANMAAAMSGFFPDEVCKAICEDIKQIATSTSRELVGWLLLSVHAGEHCVVARCVQRLEPTTPKAPTPPSRGLDPVSVSRRTYVQFIGKPVWEILSCERSTASIPYWISDHLGNPWISLLSQPGSFSSTEGSIILRPLTTQSAFNEVGMDISTTSTMASPSRTPGSSHTIRGSIRFQSDSRFVWEDLGEFQELGVVESPEFEFKEQMFRLWITVDQNSPFLMVTLGKKTTE